MCSLPLFAKTVPFLVALQPIDLNQIKQRIDKKNYRSWPQFEADMLRLFSNAKEYNVETSQIYEDAAALEALFLAAKAEIPADVFEYGLDWKNSKGKEKKKKPPKPPKPPKVKKAKKSKSMSKDMAPEMRALLVWGTLRNLKGTGEQSIGEYLSIRPATCTIAEDYVDLAVIKERIDGGLYNKPAVPPGTGGGGWAKFNTDVRRMVYVFSGTCGEGGALMGDIDKAIRACRNLGVGVGAKKKKKAGASARASSVKDVSEITTSQTQVLDRAWAAHVAAANKSGVDATAPLSSYDMKAIASKAELSLKVLEQWLLGMRKQLERDEQKAVWQKLDAEFQNECIEKIFAACSSGALLDGDGRVSQKTALKNALSCRCPSLCVSPSNARLFFCPRIGPSCSWTCRTKKPTRTTTSRSRNRFRSTACGRRSRRGRTMRCTS